MRRLAVAVVVAIVAARTSLAQQQLRGVVRDSASGAPIAGAVLLLLDSAAALVGRNITDERGQYAVLLSPRMRQLRVLRIGFRPRTLRIPPTESGLARLDVRLASIPTLLETVSVVDQPNCPRRPNSAAALALWEQARTALLATVVAREANPAQVKRLHFDRRMSLDKDSIERLEVRIDSASTSRPFVAARPASEFVERGFVDDSTGARVYHGPDADVMLDEAFAAGYCFDLAAAEGARPREVGLAFRPAHRKNNRIDIEGAVWIDSVSRVLTDIVFRYAGLSYRFDPYKLGGRVSFREMDNGTVLIDRWFIRIPTPSLRRGPSLMPLIDIHERGGEVAEARWPDGRRWVASLGTVSGTAMRFQKPATNVRLRLLNTDYETTTDSAGNFRIPSVLPGPYDVGVIDPTLADLGLTLRTTESFVAVRDSTHVVSLVAPTAKDFVASSCEAMKQGAAGEYSAVGRVFVPDGRPAPMANYDVSIYQNLDFEPYVHGRTDEQGVFVVCSLKHDDLFLFSASHSLGRASTTRKPVDHVETVRLELRSTRD